MSDRGKCNHSATTSSQAAEEGRFAVSGIVHSPQKEPLKFQAPPDTKPSDVRITLDSDTAPLAPAITAGSPMVAKLAQPLAVNSQVTVRVGTAFVTALVQAPPDEAIATLWIGLLTGFDVVFVTLALWTFEPLMTE